MAWTALVYRGKHMVGRADLEADWCAFVALAMAAYRAI